jgi:hypothetical protein
MLRQKNGACCADLHVLLPLLSTHARSDTSISDDDVWWLLLHCCLLLTCLASVMLQGQTANPKE